MAYIALVSKTADEDGKFRVKNVVMAPDHSIRIYNGEKTVRPGVFFAPEGYDGILFDKENIGIGDSYDAATKTFSKPDRAKDEVK